ncbi:hypothetical protein N9777_04980 [Ascidiaceihabitans sp.]|nr:hypothetical protein [Ascidiaceihabitans sp.]
MKPNFALSLSFEGICLLLRAADGWRLVDEVALDSTDLVGDLAKLAAKARRCSDNEISSKLIIPNDKIKYITLETGDISEDEREQLALDALEGATPYAVSDLAYDVSSDQSQTYVAAVACETLAEAKAFAREHNFNPVSWVAIPEEGNFVGEPFFGATSPNSDLTIFPDQTVLVVVGNAADIPQAIIPKLEPEHLEPEVSTIPIVETVAVSEEGVQEHEESELATPIAEQATENGVSEEQLIADSFNEVAAEKLVSPPIIPTETTKQRLAPDAVAVAPPTAIKPPTQMSENPVDVGFASRRAPNRPSPSLAVATRNILATSVISASVPSIEDTPSETPGLVAIDPPEPQIAAGFLSRRSKSGKESLPAPILTQPTTEAQRLTIFGARKADRKAFVGEKPKFLGLILTAVLLLFLAGVAAWASVFIDEGLARFFNSPNDDAIAEAPSGLAPTPSEGIGPNIETVSLWSGLSPEDTAVLDARRAPQAGPVVAFPELSAQELAVNYAVTGIWPVSPEVPQPASLISLDDLYITNTDPVSSSNDAIALPNVSALITDRGLGEQTTPVAAGTSFALGSNGLVVPTINSAITPNGVIVFLGSPAVTPPKMPERKALPEKVNPALALISKTRPQPRPSNLVEQNERSVNGGLSRSELAQLRPKLRPTVEQAVAQRDVDPATENAQKDSAAAASLAGLAPRVDGIVIEGPTNLQVVTASVRPDGRPKNFARIVKRAKANQSTDQGTRVASVAPKIVVPKNSSSASVAKSATVKNAINLRNVNLIGVYGKPSSRRALVRLSNGRYQTVQVGDRIDGGRVSAIGDNELRYKKGSRNLTLKMPKS